MTEQEIAKGLLKAGIINSKQVQAAVQQRQHGRSFTQAVIELGYVEEGQLRQFQPAAQESDAPKSQFAFRPEDVAAIQTAAEVALPAVTTAKSNSGSAARSNEQHLNTANKNGSHTNGNGNHAAHSNGTLANSAPSNGTHVNGSYANGAHSNGIATNTQPPAPSPQALPVDMGLGQDDTGSLDNGEVIYDGDEHILDDSAKGPTVRWCDELLKIAVQTRASDMHLEPRADGLLPRYRIDGHLRPGDMLPREYMPAVISRFKVLGNLDIAENRLPQDGRFRATVGGRLFDFRVSTLPGLHGEKIVLRLLDRSSLVVDLSRLGFAPNDADRFQGLLERSHGMLLVTGPTGSGKTTTLYAALAAAHDESKNVITVEDPIEYELEGVTQTKVQPGIGLTFAGQLRAILRQDPDVILVGEIRDGETAEIAIRAALTGHLVLSTLHTNSAVGAVTRLQDMGVPPFLIASSLSGVVAQRLVRMICRNCRQPLPQDHPHHTEAVERLRLPEGMQLYYGEGCEHCSGTGMRGRLALVELLEVDSPMRKAVMARQDAGELRNLALSNGMKTLWQDGIEKLGQGLTTGAELMRVLLGHEDEE